MKSDDVDKTLRDSLIRQLGSNFPSDRAEALLTAIIARREFQKTASGHLRVTAQVLQEVVRAMEKPTAEMALNMTRILNELTHAAHHGGGVTDPNRESPSLLIAPGWRVRAVLGWVYSKKTRENIFDQMIADMQEEWMEAMVAEKDTKARWIRIRGYVAIAIAVPLHLVTVTSMKVKEFWKLGS